MPYYLWRKSRNTGSIPFEPEPGSKSRRSWIRIVTEILAHLLVVNYMWSIMCASNLLLFGKFVVAELSGNSSRVAQRQTGTHKLLMTTHVVSSVPWIKQFSNAFAFDTGWAIDFEANLFIRFYSFKIVGDRGASDIQPLPIQGKVMWFLAHFNVFILKFSSNYALLPFH